MDTITREELTALQTKCNRMRMLLAAINQGIDFLDKKIAEMEAQSRRWDFRLTYKEAQKGDNEEYEN